MVTSVFFLSTGYKGGANKYLYQNLNYISKQYNSFIIDKGLDKELINSEVNIQFFKLNLLKNVIKNYLILSDFFTNKKSEKNIIFLTNFAVYLLYYFLFQKLKKKNFKIILTLHSGIFINNLKNNLLSLFFSLTSHKLDRLIYGSHSAKNWWINRYSWMKSNNNKVIYNGINLKHYKSKKKKIGKKFNISFVGRVAQENNPELFLKIVNDNKKNKKLQFHCFGNGPLRKFLNSKYIKFHGWSDQKKIYKITDLILITSKLNNFPYVALEAKCAGIPVISSSKGDIKKIINNKNDGFLLKKFDLKNFKKKINLIINRYAYFSKNAKKNSQEFDEKISLRKIWNYIQK